MFLFPFKLFEQKNESGEDDLTDHTLRPETAAAAMLNKAGESSCLKSRDICIVSMVYSRQKRLPMKSTDTEVVDCEPCIKSKMVNQKSHVPDAKATQPFEFVHCYSHCQRRIPMCNVQCALQTTIQPGLTNIYFLKSKGDAVKATRSIQLTQYHMGQCRECVQTINGREFVCKEFRDRMIENQIKHGLLVQSPLIRMAQQRDTGTPFLMGKCILLVSELPKCLWAYDIMNVSYVRNRCFNSRIHTVCPRTRQ